MEDYKNQKSVREFWDLRAGLGLWAGTNDIVAKEVEMLALERYVQEGMRILEAGCGNGVSAIHLAKKFKVDVTASDYSKEMIEAAKKMFNRQECKGNVRFQQLDILNLQGVQESYDLIFTERVIINLSTWEIQRRAIENIFKLLKPCGIFLMLENSAEGLEEINRFRASIDLPVIEAPWHNRYLKDAEIASIQNQDIKLEKIDYYSSTYYFLSRIANAFLAKETGVEPDYNAPLNRLALRLPPLGNFGQGRIWVWRRSA